MGEKDCLDLSVWQNWFVQPEAGAGAGALSLAVNFQYFLIWVCCSWFIKFPINLTYIHSQLGQGRKLYSKTWYLAKYKFI